MAYLGCIIRVIQLQDAESSGLPSFAIVRKPTSRIHCQEHVEGPVVAVLHLVDRHVTDLSDGAPDVDDGLLLFLLVGLGGRELPLFFYYIGIVDGTDDGPFIKIVEVEVSLDILLAAECCSSRHERCVFDDSFDEIVLLEFGKELKVGLWRRLSSVPN